MLSIRNNQITLTRGDTARIDLAISKDGSAYDFSADTVIFTVKESVYASDYLIQKTVTDGVIYIAPADTESLAYGTYVYDVQDTTANGDICTVIPPTKFIVAPEVTWTAATAS